MLIKKNPKYYKMDDNFSPRVKEVITFSRDEALRLGHDYIGTEHIMLGLLREGQGEAITILTNLDIDLDFLKNRFLLLIFVILHF